MYLWLIREKFQLLRCIPCMYSTCMCMSRCIPCMYSTCMCMCACMCMYMYVYVVCIIRRHMSSLFAITVRSSQSLFQSLASFPIWQHKCECSTWDKWQSSSHHHPYHPQQPRHPHHPHHPHDPYHPHNTTPPTTSPTPPTPPTPLIPPRHVSNNTVILNITHGHRKL